MESVGRKLGENKVWRRLAFAGLGGMALALAGAQVLAVPARAQSGSQSADAQKPAQSQDIPDAPSAVQPPTPPPPERLDKPPANPPDADKSANPAPAQAQKPDDFGQAGTENQPPPHMPPVETLPPGSNAGVSTTQPSAKADLLKFSIVVNSVTIPVMVKDKEGRRVDGLRPKDFTVLENGKPQQLKYFTTDPFELSVAVVIETGMPDGAVQKIKKKKKRSKTKE